MDWLKKLWPEILVVIGIVLEFSIKRLSQIEASNEKTTVISLLLAVLVALSARHFKGGATQIPGAVQGSAQGPNTRGIK